MTVAQVMGVVLRSMTRMDRCSESNTDEPGMKINICRGKVANRLSWVLRPDILLNQNSNAGVKTINDMVEITSINNTVPNR